MGNTMRRAILAMVAVVVLLICGPIGFADDTDAVRVKYTSGDTELDTLREGVKFFSNRNYLIGKIPPEISGLTFTRRGCRNISDPTLDIPAGTTVYLILDSDKGINRDNVGVGALNASLVKAAWIRLADCTIDGSRGWGVIYKQNFRNAQKLTISAAGPSGITIVATRLTLNDDRNPTQRKPDGATPRSTLHIDPSPDDKPVTGPTTHIARPQTAIKALEILEMDSGLMLGQTSEVVLTVTPGNSPKQTSVRFVTKVGDDMCLARDDALRFIRVKYPNWNVAAAEITFEDKYVAHDGGSIGTAIGAMVMSVIQGFQIDSNVAITGDISANGKVRAIGGVSAKIRGAIAGKCSLVAIPMENQGQLVDAVVYSGPAMLSEIQIIGISDLDDAVATVRVDRDEKLTQAIAMFAQVQQEMKTDPTYLKKSEATEKLNNVLELAPQHLSAQLLLAIIDGKQAKSLSFTASMYYTTLAARNMLTVLAQRAESHDRQQVASSVIRIGLNDLHKLLPLADSNVRPLINAWMRFIEAWNGLQQGEGTVDQLENRRQSLLDEMAKQNTNPELMQEIAARGVLKERDARIRETKGTAHAISGFPGC